MHDYSLSNNNENCTEQSLLTCEASWISLEGNVIEDIDSKAVNYPDPSSLNQTLLQYYHALTGVILSDTTVDIRVSFHILVVFWIVKCSQEMHDKR